MPGLLIAGKLVAVPGVDVIAPGEHPLATLSPRDGRPRSRHPSMLTVHSTGGKWPQPILYTPAPGRRMFETSKFWANDPQHSAAHIVVEGRRALNIADVVRMECYHATSVNAYSVGIEMVTNADGSIHDDTLASTVAIVLVLCDELGIPLQLSSRPWMANTIITRLKYEVDAESCVGVFGHRENAWKFPGQLSAEKRGLYPKGYADRGRGDPGDEIGVRLRAAGAMAFDFDRREDLAYWRKVQAALNAAGERLAVDGICGQRTVAALRRRGLWSHGIFVEAPIL